MSSNNIQSGELEGMVEHIIQIYALKKLLYLMINNHQTYYTNFHI